MHFYIQNLGQNKERKSHSVEILRIYFHITFFSQKFREINVFSTLSHCYTFSRNIFQVRENFSFFHSVSGRGERWFSNRKHQIHTTSKLNSAANIIVNQSLSFCSFQYTFVMQVVLHGTGSIAKVGLASSSHKTPLKFYDVSK